jgi:hypothetical protein
MAKRGRRGSARFRAALAARTPGEALPDSAPERLLAIRLTRHGLARPELQHVVRDASGAFVARVDLAYPKWKILIEYDSCQELTATPEDLRGDAREFARADTKGVRAQVA